MKNIPKVRFAEFSGEFKPYLINEAFERVVKAVDVQANEEYRQIGIRSHGKGLFYKDSISGRELGNKRVFWIEPECLIVNIVFAWERAVAKTTQNEVGMIASHRFPMYKPVENIVYVDYALYFFTTKKGQKVLDLASPGGAGRNRTLGQDLFAKSKIMLPSIKEQKKVANLLSKLDERILNQQNIVSDLENQKKSLMQKIFTQEVSFSSEEKIYDEWESKQIKDCLDYEQPTKYIVDSNEYDDRNSLPVLTANKGFILGYTDETDGIYNKGDVIIYDDFTMDSKYVNFQFKVKSSAMKMLTAKEDIDLYFMYCYFKYLNFSQEEHSRSYLSKVEPLWILMPSYEEQQQIAECLGVFDKKIEAENKILEDWQTIKKGLLQQMFV